MRASLYGAGVAWAFDGTDGASVAAGTGGILQISSYMTGLSGGSWMISSLAANSMPPVPQMVLGSDRYQGWAKMGSG